MSPFPGDAHEHAMKQREDGTEPAMKWATPRETPMVVCDKGMGWHGERPHAEGDNCDNPRPAPPDGPRVCDHGMPSEKECAVCSGCLCEGGKGQPYCENCCPATPAPPAVPQTAQGVADAPACEVGVDEALGRRLHSNDMDESGACSCVACEDIRRVLAELARLRAESAGLNGDLKDKTQECADVSRLLEITHKRLLEANTEAANRNASLASENERAERYLREALALEKQLAAARAESAAHDSQLAMLVAALGGDERGKREAIWLGRLKAEDDRVERLTRENNAQLAAKDAEIVRLSNVCEQRLTDQQGLISDLSSRDAEIARLKEVISVFQDRQSARIACDYTEGPGGRGNR